MALTREQLIDAAVSVLSEFGLADLSMRRLARELDVQVGALYWHVKSKQELLVDVAAKLLGKVPQPSMPTRQMAPLAIAALLDQLRSALLTIPDSAEVVQLAQTMRPEALAPLGWLLEFLEHAGIPADQALYARHLLLNHLLGSIAAHQEARALAEEPDAVAHAAGSGQEAFEYGIRVILQGLAVEHPASAE
ncbi:TetR family transcriptional regulator [Arthrobacter sp. MYb227]|uniref:TetR family transcriptional regulator n=1 Tax=Arthrobacter sp. MYb227 TaxID=1848601 RepID=UPI000CFD8D32|nr:TetR family transcriptional regulator [Arthrobacter sp. MYb227]PQZ89097.1 TetR family transcriptional regulator [Arthrobacter sp. MYb227]